MADVHLNVPRTELSEVKTPTTIRVNDSKLCSQILFAHVQPYVVGLLCQALEIHRINIFAVAKPKSEQRAVRVDKIDHQWTQDMPLHEWQLCVIMRIPMDLLAAKLRALKGINARTCTVVLNAAFVASLYDNAGNDCQWLRYYATLDIMESITT
jgi:hypothetical protein